MAKNSLGPWLGWLALPRSLSNNCLTAANERGLGQLPVGAVKVSDFVELIIGVNGIRIFTIAEQ